MKTRFLAATLCVFFILSVAQAVEIATVHVGNPGNVGDTTIMFTDGTSGYGAVAYEYNIDASVKSRSPQKTS